MSDALKTAEELGSTADEDATEVDRIIRTGTTWFAAGILAVTVPVGSLLSGGWRPVNLPEPEAAVFWIGAVLCVLSLAALAWAGCPVLGETIPEARRSKTLSIRSGVVLLIAGTMLGAVAVLLGPS